MMLARQSGSRSGLLVVAVAVLVLLTAGPAPAQETVKIGIAIAMTGAASYVGIGARRGAEIAIDEVNAKGGIKGKKLELVIRDDEHNPVKTVAQTRELVERERVVAMLGASNSASMLAVTPIVNDQLKVPVVCPATDATAITENAAWKEGRENYLFRMGMYGRAQSNFLVNTATQKFGFKKPALLTWTAGWGVTGRSELNRRLGELNLKPVADETYDSADTDITPQLLKIRAGGADAILNYGLVRENVVVMRTRDKLGDKTPYFSAWGLSPHAFARAAGPLAEGTLVSTTLTSDGPQSPERTEFLKKYTQRYGPEMESVTTTFAAYDIIHLYAQVMEKVGTDPKAIRAGLENVAQFKGLIKEFKRPVFTREKHDALHEDDYILARWTGGKLLEVQWDGSTPYVVVDGTKRQIDKATAALR
jgi:branched-chain amino acid transport system substrate-binding protein